MVNFSKSFKNVVMIMLSLGYCLGLKFTIILFVLVSVGFTEKAGSKVLLPFVVRIRPKFLVYSKRFSSHLVW